MFYLRINFVCSKIDNIVNDFIYTHTHIICPSNIFLREVYVLQKTALFIYKSNKPINKIHIIIYYVPSHPIITRERKTNYSITLISQILFKNLSFSQIKEIKE